MKNIIFDKVYSRDTDAGKIAYHKAYFDWAEKALEEIFSPFHLADNNIIFHISSSNIDYKIPLVIKDEIKIETHLVYYNENTLSSVQLICKKSGEIAAEISSIIAFLNSSTFESVVIPEEVKRALL